MGRSHTREQVQGSDEVAVSDLLAHLETLHASVSSVIEPVFIVGGAVRDALLGCDTNDLDLATPRLPDEMTAMVRAAGLRPYVSGRKHGTIGFKLDGHLVEVTTFRSVSYGTSGRGPRVAFVDQLVDDLVLRDFTINAIALSGRDLVDPCGGLDDLRDHVLRAPGKPRDRFRDDPLRMLRAARFVSQLGFELDSETLRAMKRTAPRLLDAAVERWTPELDNLLAGSRVSLAFRLLAETGVLRYALPELQLQVGYDQNSPYHSMDLFEHSLAVVEGVGAGDVSLRWAALLHDIGKPYSRTEKPGRSNYIGHEILGAELVERLALYLRWSRDRSASIGALVAGHMDVDSPLREADQRAKLALGR